MNGYALVRNADNQYGVINQDGDMTVDFGQHEDLETRGGLYEATDGTDRTIIKGNGDVVVANYINAIEATGAPYVTVETESQKYAVYNATGSKIMDFNSATRPAFNTYNKKMTTSMSYDGHIAIFNNKTLKKIKDQETNAVYRLSATSEDMKTIVLRGTIDSKTVWAVLKDGKFKEYGEDCTSITLVDNTNSTSDYKYMTCSRSDGVYLMRGLDVSDINLREDNNHAVVFDEKHYARYDSKEGKAKIYVDNSEKLSVDSDALPVVRNKGYYVVDGKNKYSALYDLDGNKLYELGTARGSLNGLDNNERIIVNDPTVSNINEYYSLVNKDGKTISKKYSSIARNGEYYSALDNVNKTADLLDKDGNVIVSGNYTAFKFYRDGKLIFGQIANDKYDLIDTKDKSVKRSLEGQLSVGKDDYFSIKTDSETVFYTIKGKDFYHQGK